MKNTAVGVFIFFAGLFISKAPLSAAGSWVEFEDREVGVSFMYPASWIKPTRYPMNTIQMRVSPKKEI